MGRGIIQRVGVAWQLSEFVEWRSWFVRYELPNQQQQCRYSRKERIGKRTINWNETNSQYQMEIIPGSGR